jgi:hypothetical protein
MLNPDDLRLVAHLHGGFPLSERPSPTWRPSWAGPRTM